MDLRADPQHVCGEKLLLAAVIRRAAYDIAIYRGSTRLEHRKIWRDAYDWMFRPPDSYDDPDEEFMSFLNLCELLKADPEHIREATRKMTKQDIKRYQMVEPNYHDPLISEFDEEVEDVD